MGELRESHGEVDFVLRLRKPLADGGTMTSLPPVRMGRQWHRTCRSWKKGPNQNVANREERANRSECGVFSKEEVHY